MSLFVVTRRLSVIDILVVATAVLFGRLVLDAAAESQASGSETASWYVSSVVTGRSGFRVTYYWSKGSNLRTQTLIGIRPLTTIVRGDRYWVFDELRKEGVEIKRSPRSIAEDATRIRPFGNDLEDLIRTDGEKVETGILDGIPAETWRATNATGRRTVWVTTSDPPLPIRVENFDRDSGETITVNYSNWVHGFDLPDSTFEPPSDLRLEKFEYEQFVEASVEGLASPILILYPRLLHGLRPR